VTVGLIAGEPDVTTTIVLMGAAWVINLVIAEIAIRRGSVRRGSVRQGIA
jgi:hypothetical protein